MDPDAAFAELLAAVGDREWDRIDELADGLLQWLQRRGFPPLTVGSKSLGKEWHSAVATFVCHAAKSKVRDARRRRKRARDDA
ncbi:MAG: hypothetical protein SH850_00480 [Planctomycetaceae bacterium]|nr:hypothetical protein [Planctomycetaceae bacterium]